jgi:predicted RNA methylase
MLSDASPDLFNEPPETKQPAKLRSTKAHLGQFFTPSAIAEFMAAAFPQPSAPVMLLDPGAGEGALTEAFINRWSGCVSISAVLYELDPRVLPALNERMGRLRREGVSIEVTPSDFLESAAAMLVLERGDRFTHVIMNPPYRKIGTSSRERGLISKAGLETVNLYSGFVALALDLLRPGGQLVAIIPRSFCNGPYYKPFRRFITSKAAIRSIHLFESRSDAFSADDVLQENIIIALERGGAQGDVTVSTSRDTTFADLESRYWEFGEIVSPDDPQLFIHIPTPKHGPRSDQQYCDTSIEDLGLKVSTGPVVDFRLRDHLRLMPDEDSVPLLYPLHLRGSEVTWPIEGAKKANAIARNRETEKWLFPAGWYAAVKRFSSKEERRRVVASIIDPARLKADALGFENHINLFHAGRKPLSPEIAAGLTIYLNTTAVDAAFRRFNGHTQVNATDLRQLSYPTRSQLEEIGRRGQQDWPANQEAVDDLVGEILASAK